MTRIQLGPMLMGILAAIVAAGLVVVVGGGTQALGSAASDRGSSSSTSSTSSSSSSSSSTTPTVQDPVPLAGIDLEAVVPLSCRSQTVAIVVSVPSAEGAQMRSILAGATGIPAFVVAPGLCDDEPAEGGSTPPNDLVLFGPFRDRPSADAAAEVLRRYLSVGAGRDSELDTIELEEGVDLDGPTEQPDSDESDGATRSEPDGEN